MLYARLPKFIPAGWSGPRLPEHGLCLWPYLLLLLLLWLRLLHLLHLLHLLKLLHLLHLWDSSR